MKLSSKLSYYYSNIHLEYFHFILYILFRRRGSKITSAMSVLHTVFFFSLIVFAFCKGDQEGIQRGPIPGSYTRVVEWPCGKLVLFWLPPKVLKLCRGCKPASELGIIVMVLGVIRGISSGDRRRVRV